MAVGKAHRVDAGQTTRQATRVKIAFNRLGSERLAVGTPDPRQPANLRDDTERYVTLRLISRTKTKLCSALLSLETGIKRSENTDQKR